MPNAMDEPDILGDLIFNVEVLIPEGTYRGKVENYEFRTSHRGTPYVVFGVKIPQRDRPIFVMQFCPISMVPLMKYFASKLVGIYVDIKITHRQVDERTYLDCRFREVIDPSEG